MDNSMPSIFACKKALHEHVRMEGGWIELQESDRTLNKISRGIIRAVKRERGQAWIGKINVYEGHNAKMREYKYGMVRNFEADYVIPFHDTELESMIEEYNSATDRMVIGEYLTKILGTIDRSGYLLHWT